jgi:lipid A 3-O-deacylase
MKAIAILFSFFLLTYFSANAQKSDSLKQDQYFRLNYDNDFFSATDRYYTQGILAEFISPVLKKSPFSKMLISLKNATQNYYGLAFEQDCFTPVSIQHNTIYKGERPFAATMFISSFLTSISQEKKQRLTTALDLGIMGPCAVCEQEQKGIHRWLNNIQPLGWQFQIATDYIVNYRAKFEQGLYTTNHFEFVGSTEARVGTIYDDASAGVLFRFGFMNSYFRNIGLTKNPSGKKFQLYVYANARVSGVIYNATMQGGMFENNSIYIINAKNIQRVVFMGSAGVVAAFKRFSLEFTKVYISPEFYNGLDHGWGHVVITTCF